MSPISPSNLFRSRPSEEHVVDTAEGVVFLTTVPSREKGQEIARVLINERLCACVSLVPEVLSVYRWEEAVTTEHEVQLVIKTSVAAVSVLRRRLLELHPYDLPAITMIEASYGAAFGDWVSQEVAPHSRPSVVILASGRGSNALSIMSNQGAYRVSAIISDRRDAPVKTHAESHGVKFISYPSVPTITKEQFQRRIARTLADLQPDLIVLAGFMQVLKPWFVHDFSGRIINIHPSLLPKYPGLNTHQRAIEAGESEHGATVHLVDQGVDTGPIIAQVKVPVHPDDREELLAARVLEQEHRLLPWVVNSIVRGFISISKGRVTLTGQAVANAHEHGFIVPS